LKQGCEHKSVIGGMISNPHPLVREVCMKYLHYNLGDPISYDDLLDQIEKLIRLAGLYKSKARAIKEACERKEEIEEAVRRGVKEPLLKIKGIGKKTADVVLLNFGHSVFPVDTHIFRVSRRVGIPYKGYDDLSGKLRKTFEGEELEAHMYLILLGRRICKSKSPSCDACPFRNFCKFRLEVAARRRP